MRVRGREPPDALPLTQWGSAMSANDRNASLFPSSACVILDLIINLQKGEDLRCHMIPLRAPSRKVPQSPD
jgi:hypothetical protein